MPYLSEWAIFNLCVSITNTLANFMLSSYLPTNITPRSHLRMESQNNPEYLNQHDLPQVTGYIFIYRLVHRFAIYVNLNVNQYIFFNLYL